MSSNGFKPIQIAPSARRLTQSLRDVGYSFSSAVADLVDNSIAANARQVDIDLNFDGPESWVRITDDGEGMGPKRLNEALRFGSQRAYGRDDLGRFGLGLKTASLSQGRRITVSTRVSPQRRWIHTRQLDLDHVGAVDRWEVKQLHQSRAPMAAVEPLRARMGTVVLWENLDRVLDYERPDGAWARRRFTLLAADLQQHLGMVFHRFIDGEISGRDLLKITVNGTPVMSWDPFARMENETIGLSQREFEITHGAHHGRIGYRPFVLPHRSAFSTQAAFDHYSGPRKWNRQQGFYVYRAGRLIQSGGWNGIRAIDEHHKFARAAIEFSPDLDPLFKVNVAKMRISLPAPLRPQLEREVSELCRQAASRYRRGELARHEDNGDGRSGSNGDMGSAGVALRAAAFETGDLEALDRITTTMKQRVPGLVERLGLAD